MYKIKYALKKSKSVVIMILILWIAFSIAFIVPGTVSKVDATVNGELHLNSFLGSLSDNFSNMGQSIKKMFDLKYTQTFLRGELYLIIILVFLSAVGILKSLPKNEYTDIEHGSSDWATGGEQYKILSPKKGIILAEKNYLPVDKRGNVNVLVVGRFWFW